MLFAEKENLASAFRLRMLSIRDKELDFFMRNMQNVASLSALLAGLGQSGLIYTKYINMDLCGKDEFLCAEFTYPLAAVLTMCLALFSMWGCMLVTMLAPGLALRGPQGSMDQCVDMVAAAPPILPRIAGSWPPQQRSPIALLWTRLSASPFGMVTVRPPVHQVVQEYQYSLFIFSCALIMLMVSAVLWSWTLHNHPAGISLTLVILGCMYLIYVFTCRARDRFNVPRSKLVTGRFHSAKKGFTGLSGKEPTRRRPLARSTYERLLEVPSDSEHASDSDAVAEHIIPHLRHHMARGVAGGGRGGEAFDGGGGEDGGSEGGGSEGGGSEGIGGTGTCVGEGEACSECSGESREDHEGREGSEGWRRPGSHRWSSRPMRLQGAPLPWVRAQSKPLGSEATRDPASPFEIYGADPRHEALCTLVNQAASFEGVFGMVGLTAAEHQELQQLRRSAALGSLACEAAAKPSAGGLIGLSIEEEHELRDFQREATREAAAGSSAEASGR